MSISLHQFKRTAIHNVCIAGSQHFSPEEIPEGIVLPRKLMSLGDIVPFERVLVTKHGGDNWRNRMWSFAIPGNGPGIETRGATAHLATGDEICCLITGTVLSSKQYTASRNGTLGIPLIDIRFHPRAEELSNDMSTMRLVLESGDRRKQVQHLDPEVIEKRQKLPRIMLTNLVCGLKVNKIERHCEEMSAELPEDIMKKAGLAKNQTIVVFNASRGGISAESYVVPNLQNMSVVISGALSRVADEGDFISEASFAITDEINPPTIYNAKTGNKVQI